MQNNINMENESGFNASDEEIEIDVLKFVVEGMQEKITDLENKIAILEKENEELKEFKPAFVTDDFSDLIDYQDFIDENDHVMREFLLLGKLGAQPSAEVYSVLTYGPSKWLHYTFDGEECHYYWDEQQAIDSLNTVEAE